MTVQVYCKSAVDKLSFEATYAYMLTSHYGPFADVALFKKKVKTFTHADCGAYVNALHYLSTVPAVDEIEVIEIITDSGAVADLIEFYKFQKWCEEAVNKWRDEIKPRFKALQRVEIKKVKIDKVVKAGDTHAFNLKKCAIAADDRLLKLKEILK